MVRGVKRGLLVAALGVVTTAGAAQVGGPAGAPGASAAASNTTLIRDASGMTAGGILGAISGGGAFGGSYGAGLPSGSSAANGGQSFGTWADGGYQHTRFDSDLLPYDANIYQGAAGFDYRISKWLVLGVAGGYENWDSNTGFDTGTLKTNGYTAAPYAVLLLGKYVTVGATGGYSSLSNDETRDSGSIRGSFDSKRYFGAAAVNANYRGGNWLFNGSFTYIYTDQKDDAYTETGAAGAGAVTENTAKIAQGRLGFKIGYDLGGFAPYGVARIEHEFTHPGTVSVSGTTVTNSDTGYVLGAGLNFTRGAVSAGLEADSVEARANLKVYQVLGNLRFLF